MQVHLLGAELFLADRHTDRWTDVQTGIETRGS